MKVIRDRTEGEWIIEVTLPVIDRVREGCNVNLVDVEDPPLVRLFEDFRLTATVLYWMCHDKVEKEGMSEQDFLNKWDGATLEEAAFKIAEELTDFFPPRMRPVLKEQTHRIRHGMEKAEKTIEKLVEDKDWEKVLNRRLDQMVTDYRKTFSDGQSSTSQANLD